MSVPSSRERPTFNIDWRKPQYDEVFRYRAKNLKFLRANPSVKESLLEYYRGDWVAFIEDWFYTFDPRKVASDEPFKNPFILWGRQRDFVLWVKERFERRERGLAEKTREVGFSWLACSCAVIIYLLYPGATIGFGSRKKESVDNGVNDSDSLFWKVRFIIENLPKELQPKDYGDGNKWAVVANQENNSVIKGEIGDSIGMGGRSAIYFVDEADALEHQQLVEASLSATTDCRIDISTANQVGSLFYNTRRQLPSTQVFVIDWWEDPRKRLNPEQPKEEEPWYKQKVRELNSTTLASQVNRNPSGALGNTYFPAVLVQEKTETSKQRIIQPPTTHWRIGVDASGMGNDETILWRRRGRLNLPPKALGNLDGVQMAMRVVEEAKTLLKLNQGGIELIAIERDGPGGSCADQLKYTDFAKITRALHTGAKLDDGKHYNIRSWLHSQAKEYMEENEVHLPNDPIFISQITALLYEYKGGLLLMESKEDYKKRLSGMSARTKGAGKSPDRSDAFILTFAPPLAPILPNKIEDLGLFVPRTEHKVLDAVFGY